MNKKVFAIIQIFTEIVTYTKIIIDNEEQFIFEEVQSNYIELFENTNTELKKYNLDERSTKFIFLAFVGWVDEQILLSQVSFKNNWLKNSLQKRYFNLTTIGDDFFAYYDEFKQQDNYLKLIYIYILCLGFKGKYLIRTKELNELIEKELSEFNKEESINFFKNVYSTSKSKKEPRKRFFYFKLNYIIFSLLVSVCLIFTMNFFLNKKVLEINSNYENKK